MPVQILNRGVKFVQQSVCHSKNLERARSFLMVARTAANTAAHRVPILVLIPVPIRALM